MSDEFIDLGMGPGIKPGARPPGAKAPEEVARGRSAVYDRARTAGATVEQALREEALTTPSRTSTAIGFSRASAAKATRASAILWQFVSLRERLPISVR